MRNALRLGIFLLAILAVTPSYGAAPPAGMTLYDNFNSKFFNPDKWVGQSAEADSAHRVLREGVIEIERNQLHLLSCAWACTDCGDNGTLYAQSRLRALGALSTTAKAFQATVQAKQMSVVGSDVNTSSTQARLRMLGWFFNNGGSTGTSDSTGDVFAWIGLRRRSDSPDPPGVLTIVGVVGLCTDSACNNSTNTEATLGTVKSGTTKTTLYLEWDNSNQKFVFKWLNGKKTKTAEITYLQAHVSNIAPRVNVVNRLEVGSTVPNDTGATGQRPMAFTEAYFDDVYYK